MLLPTPLTSYHKANRDYPDDGDEDGGGHQLHFDMGGGSSSGGEDDFDFVTGQQGKQVLGAAVRGLSCDRCGSRNIQAIEDQTMLKCMVCHNAIAADALNATVDDY